MGFILKLQHGANSVNLNGSTYRAAVGWAPPAPIMDTQFASGNRSNTYGGGTVIDRQYLDNVANVPLNIVGNSAAETHRAARQLINFINSALADQSEKLYLVYNADDSIPYEPKWGQHHHYYEIKDATAALRRLSDYLTTEVRTKVIFLTLPFTTAPLPDGLSQLVGSATGTILERAWATGDGISRGVIINGAETNAVDNPIFGNSTWDQDWTTRAGLVLTENTNKEYVLFGTSSARAYTVASANNAFYTQPTLAAGDAILACYVKMHDKSEVTVAKVWLEYNGGAVTETYTAVGDGWYFVQAPVTGTGGAAPFDIYVERGQEIYVDGAMAIEGAYCPPIIHGDLLDGSWASTEHDSDSTITAARLRWPTNDILNMGQFTVRVVWVPDRDFDDFSGIDYFLFDDDCGVRCWYDGATDDFRLTDGTSTADSSTQAFVAGDVIVLHFVMSDNEGINIYINGSLDGTSATYTPNVISDYFYLGSSTTPGNRCGGTFLDLTTWDLGLTATEIGNDYDNIQQRVNGGDGYGQRLNAIPWLWTDDGDDTVDNCYDSTRENWFVCGGIPGNVQAKTDWRIKYGTDWYTAAFSWFGSIQRLTYNALASGTDLQSQYYDYNSTATTVADSGSSVFTWAVGTTEFDFGTPLSTVAVSLHIDEMFGSNYHLYFRLSDAGSDLQARIHIYGGSDGAIDYASDWETIAADSTMRGFCIGPIHIDRERLDGLLDIPERYQVALALKRTTGSADITADFAIAMPSPWVYVRDRSAVVDTALSIDCIMTGGKAALVQDGTSNLHATTTVEKDGDFDLFPNAANLIYSAMGDGQYAMTVTLTAQFEINVTPRWALL